MRRWNARYHRGQPLQRAAGIAITAADFERRDEMIPMRDGVRLHTVILVPKGLRAALPMLFKRTPYGVDAAPAAVIAQLPQLAADGYIFAYQDLRGRFKSEGRFVMMRPMRSSRRSTSCASSTSCIRSSPCLSATAHHL